MISSTRLDGVALVVGGRGIGQQAAFSLPEAEAEVIYAQNRNYRIASLKVDVTKPDQVQSMVDFVVREFGRIDYCVNSAGVDNDVYRAVADTDIDNFDTIYRRGAIVNCTYANSFPGLPGNMCYTVSKHAVMGLTKMAGIRCNGVCPTWVRSPLLDEELKKNPEVQGAISAIVPAKRAAECEEVSDAMLSYASRLVNDSAVTTTFRLH
ncbi:hypothetical protein BGW36DRAFT_392836 [Talaromyces proteolyticus]|uniref:Uncharacterized protein n=1 Tax=Talaromyces proteolyticus TaxID=1131652 RepID=A0AAD4L5U6_9EURO|nr:uncharacterized protein BGW36DRAFT_392836 [Talaromyces proteolyticus]KAH8705140.1 hypothetical protein BGW36DRAFT_392836 [Talaromyces proteolyticus]